MREISYVMRALMTRKSYAVEMHNAILGNHLNLFFVIFPPISLYGKLVPVQYRKYEYHLFIHEDHFISTGIIRNLLYQTSIQHNDERLKKFIQGRLKRSRITELYLKHNAISLTNRLVETFVLFFSGFKHSWFCGQYVRKEHSYLLNTSI